MKKLQSTYWERCLLFRMMSNTYYKIYNINMSNIEPELNPDDPQKKGNEASSSADASAGNQSNGILNIDKLYPDKPILIPYQNPYSINGGGGGNMKQYRFISKPGKFLIHGRNPMDALRNGLDKLENENGDIYNRRRQITVNLQKESNRENKLHKFMIKIFRIDHPVYRYKIELWKF